MNVAKPLWAFNKPAPPKLTNDKDYDPILLGPIKAIPPGDLFYLIQFYTHF